MIFGDGTQARDFVYVDDIVGSLLAAVGQRRRAVQRRHRPRHHGRRAARCLRARVAGVEQSPRLEPARLGDIQRSVLDASLIERELGWRPLVSLEDGLARTWAWMQEQAAA